MTSAGQLDRSADQVGVGAEPQSERRRASLQVSALPVLLVVTIAYGLIAVPRFGSVGNIRTMLLSAALVGIIAVGLSLMTISGSLFSLSIAPMVGVSTVVFAKVLGSGAFRAMLLAIALGLLIGVVQGFFVGYQRSDPILTTLAVGAITLGLGQSLTQGRIVISDASGEVFQRNYLGVPGEVVALILVMIIVDQFHRRTRLGREITLSGLNAKAAEIAGVRVAYAKMISIVIFGGCVGLAGGLLSSRAGQGNLTLGTSLAFSAIAAVVIGGISVSGGVGRPVNAAVGALYVSVLGNVLLLSGLSYEVQLSVQGLLVLVAVITPSLLNRVRGGGAR